MRSKWESCPEHKQGEAEQMALQESFGVNFLPVTESLYELTEITSAPCISSLGPKLR